MHRVTGGCHCGNIALEMELTGAPLTYHPRACDCDFCEKHGAAYVSDARGSLRIRVNDRSKSSLYRQGSGAAECLICRDCGVLVGAMYRDQDGLYATVNASATNARADFGERHTASPKELPGADKIQRWREIWFSDVDLVIGANNPAR